PTEYPCQLILDPQNDYETLRRPVERTTLKAQPVNRNRSGVTNEEQNIEPQYFTFRWLTLLLSQEFLLPDVIRTWDTLFSDQDRFNFLIVVCCGVLALIRDDLLAGDFTVNMRLLQDYSTTDVSKILTKAKELQDNS
ncbi:TBC1 domain family member 13-like, partial [Xenentodon cancila]